MARKFPVSTGEAGDAKFWSACDNQQGAGSHYPFVDRDETLKRALKADDSTL